jgi:hypothetical protein
MNIAHIPLRLATGAFILNSGLSKRGLPAEAAAGIHGMAAGAIPQFKDVPPEKFVKALTAGEIALGAALLAPFVSSRLAGLGLAAFGAGLVQLYLNTPGMHEPGDVRPTQEGLGLAKDVWLLGGGLTLFLDSFGN